MTTNWDPWLIPDYVVTDKVDIGGNRPALGSGGVAVMVVTVPTRAKGRWLVNKPISYRRKT